MYIKNGENKDWHIDIKYKKLKKEIKLLEIKENNTQKT